MSSEVEEKSFTQVLESPVESQQRSRKQPRCSYTRDFLLSLRGLETCRKLPNGFPTSLLSEFEDASYSSYEQQRNLGSSYFQSAKHVEYGLVQSNKFDSSDNYSRGSQGRWDTRSSGSSDREEVHGDRDSSTLDSGKRYLTQSRSSWQHTEHDGLLGKPSGYSGQTPAQRAQGNGTYQLSKCSEPYQPPRPYKVTPFSRKNVTDSINDETFGSECSSKDRAEEEKRRRASFELMRKEQQKALQEKKNLPGQDKKNLDTDIDGLFRKLEDSEATRNNHDNKSEKNGPQLVLQSDSSRFSLHTQSSAARPLVPPGFASATVEKSHSLSSLDTSLVLKIGKTGVDVNFVQSKEIPMMDERDTIFEKERKTFSTSHCHVQPQYSHKDAFSMVDANDKIASSSLGLDILSSLPGYLPFESPILLDVAEDQKSGIAPSTNKEAENCEKTVAISQKRPSSFLDKLFQNALTTNDGGTSKLEHQGFDVDEETSRLPPTSSKFSSWFHDESTKPVEDLSSKNLLSLIVRSEKVEGQASALSDSKFIENNSPIETNESRDIFFMSDVSSCLPKIPEPCLHVSKSDPSSGILTCEDLEQSILAEVNAVSPSLQCSERMSSGALDPKPEPLKDDVDNNASQHILSLLHQGTSSEDFTTFFNADRVGSYEYDVPGGMPNKYASDIDCATSERAGIASKTKTLEALFGTDFMKELQSAEAPISIQRSLGEAINSNKHPLELLFRDTSATSYRSHSLVETNMSGYYNSDVRSQRDPDSGQGIESLQPKATNLAKKMHFDEYSANIRLLEDESLISVGEATYTELLPGGRVAKSKEPLLLKAGDNNVEKRAASVSRICDETASSLTNVDAVHPVHRPYDHFGSDPSFSQLFGRPSLAQFQNHQITQMRPPVKQVDSHAHINSSMNFFSHDQIHHETRHPFPPNVTHHHSFQTPGRSGFEPASHLQTLLHMSVPGNFPVLQAHSYPRVPPTQPLNHTPPSLPEINSTHGIPLNNHQPGYRGLGMGLPGNAGMNPPETFEQLIEMELRAKSKQNHPFAGVHASGIYGPNIDMGLRYR